MLPGDQESGQLPRSVKDRPRALGRQSVCLCMGEVGVCVCMCAWSGRHWRACSENTHSASCGNCWGSSVLSWPLPLPRTSLPPSTVLGEDPPQIQRCVLWWVGGGRPLGVSTWQTPCLRAAGMGGTLQKSGPSEPQSREGPG